MLNTKAADEIQAFAKDLGLIVRFNSIADPENTRDIALLDIALSLRCIADAIQGVADFTKGAFAGFTGVLSGRLGDNMMDLLKNIMHRDDAAQPAVEAIDPTPCSCKHPRYEHLDNAGPCLTVACPCEHFT